MNDRQRESEAGAEPKTEDEGHKPYAVDDGLEKEVRSALQNDDGLLVGALVEPLHPADLADLIESLPRPLGVELVAILGDRFDADTLAHMEDGFREEFLRALGPDGTVAVLSELETDDALDLIADLDDVDKERILARLPREARLVLEQGLAFDEYTAGRLMQRAVVAVPDYWVVGQTIDYLRANDDLPDEFYDIYIVDPRFQPVGAVPLSNILRSKRATPMRELRMKSLHSLAADTDQEEVAHIFRQYGLVSAPVVDASGRLLGAITVDDVVDVINEEAEDDILKLGGVQQNELFRSPWRTAMQRMPWLLVNLATAVVASLVIAMFDDAIGKVVALAILMPIVASMGGNAGTQTLTVTVRSLAVKELDRSNRWRVLGKEIVVGLLNSALFLIAGLILALFWFGDPLLAGIFALAMIINLVAAAIAGFLIPIVIDRLGWDPAVSSGVFLTTVTDVVGFFAFLGLAVLWLL